MSKSLDDIISAFNSAPEGENSFSKEDFLQKVETYRKGQKKSQVIEKSKLVAILLMLLSASVLTSNWIISICLLLLFVVTSYTLYRYHKFDKKMNEQDYSESVMAFNEHRRANILEEVKVLELMRYLIYPLLVAMNIGHIVGKTYEPGTTMFVVQIIFSLVGSIIAVLYMERSIRELLKRAKSLE